MTTKTAKKNYEEVSSDKPRLLLPDSSKGCVQISGDNNFVSHVFINSIVNLFRWLGCLTLERQQQIVNGNAGTGLCNIQWRQAKDDR